MTSPGGSSGPSVPPALRLLFEYDGDDVRLVDQQPVDMAVAESGLPEESVTGNHVELRGPNEELLGRVPIRSAMSTSVEVFPEAPGEPITRTDVPAARGAFTVVVPAVAQADHVAVVRIGAEPDRPATEEAPERGRPQIRELGSFRLEGHQGS